MNSNIYAGPIMKKISEEIEKQVNEEVKKYQLTLTQIRVILFLSEQSARCATQKQLEDFLQVSHPTTVTIINSMQAKKIVKCEVSEENRRMKLVYLIWGNEALYKEISVSAENMEQKLLQGFSEEEQKIFHEFLTRAYQNLL